MDSPGFLATDFSSESSAAHEIAGQPAMGESSSQSSAAHEIAGHPAMGESSSQSSAAHEIAGQFAMGESSSQSSAAHDIAGRAPMAMQDSSSGKGTPEIPATPNSPGSPDIFKCCYCLSFIHKPVVIECGHTFCLWCLFDIIRSSETSICPLCRVPFNHLPRICGLLDKLLKKIAPAAHERREKEVLDVERKMETFSAQYLDYQVYSGISGRYHFFFFLFYLYFSHLFSYDLLGNASSFLVRYFILFADIENSGENTMDAKSFVPRESSTRETCLEVGMCREVSLNDVICNVCKKLLFRPVVLICGHVCCRSCLPVPIGRSLLCGICQCLHPCHMPAVCYALDEFVATHFANEYVARKDLSQSSGHRSKSSSHTRGIADDRMMGHYNVGCDSCGMYPITGIRYKCKDCKEPVGYDLCEKCYLTRSEHRGRFNQKHNADHEFELDDSMLILGKLREVQESEFQKRKKRQDQ